MKKKLFKNQIFFRIVKENTDIFKKFLTSSFNEGITFSQFPSTMTLADIKSSFNTDDKNLKSTLCFSPNKIAKPQYGTRKGFNTQDCLIVMIKKWKKALITKEFLEFY